MKAKFFRPFLLILGALFFAAGFCYAQQFAVIGDYRNKTEATAKVAALVKSWNPDFVITCGDNFDLTAGNIDDQVGQFYSEFIYPYKGIYVPGKPVNRFFPVIGNHELKLDGLPIYLEYFTLPGNERYYDFVQGNIHFFMLNSNTSEPDGTDAKSVQAVWLKNQLEQSVSVWNIVVLHQPPYSSGSHGSNTVLQWPFALWGADAVIAGHDHMYERIYLEGIPYFVNGLGGANIYSFADTIPGSEFQFNSNYGAQRIFATENELKFQFYSIKDSLVDSFTLNRNNSAIQEKKSSNERVVYPNPAENFISFAIPVSEVVIFNSIGQTVINKQLNPVTKSGLEINNFPKGVYFIHLQSPEGKKSYRFVKL